MEAGAEVNCMVDGGQLNALDLARSHFVTAVSVIEKQLEERADRLHADALVQDSELLHPHLVPDLVQLVSDHVAMQPTTDRKGSVVDSDDRSAKRRCIRD